MVKFLTLIIIFTFSLSPVAFSADCKGSSASSCKSSNSCAWVPGHTRSNGAKVSSYCRAKGGKAGKKSAKTKSKKTKDKSKDKKSSKSKKEKAKSKDKKKKSKDKKKSKKDKKKKKKKSKTKKDKKDDEEN